MHIALQLRRLSPSARPSVVVCVVLSAALLAACGNNSTSTPLGTATPRSSADATGSATTPSAARASASGAASPAASAVNVSPGASAIDSVDACTLATAAELADIVGIAVTGAEMLAGGWVTSGCSWSGSTSSFIVSIGTASSFVKSGDPAASDAKDRLVQYKQQANGSDATGFGDGAVLTANGMAAYKGDTYVEVEKLRLTDPQLQKIMTLLLSRL